LPGDVSRVAVIWEGGYPDVGALHPQLEARAGQGPFQPIVFVHDLTPGARPGRVRWHEGVHHTLLDVPLPPGDAPAAQRFRAPAIEWYRWPGGGDDEWGFLVILSSQNAVEQPEFLHHWIQRFDLDGKPVGEPIDLEEVAPPEIAHANWEGLAWWERGKSVVMVHEGRGDTPPHAFIFELPEDWQFSDG
jgi:hypothetical protein